MTLILALVQLIGLFTRMDAVQATSVATARNVGVGTVDAATIQPGSWLRWRHNAGAYGGVAWNSGAASNEIAQRTSKLVSALISVSRVFLHATKNDCLECRIYVGVDQRWWLRSLVDLLHSNADSVVTSKRNAASCSLVHDNAQGIDIGGWSQRLARTLLWRNVMGGAKNRVIGG